jgi:hypothetical protein
MFLLMTMIGKNGEKNNLSFKSKPDTTVVLFDSTMSLSDLKKFVEQKSTTIISIDYSSHKILSANGIMHEISDNYLNESDLKMIQNDSFTFSKWFEGSDVQEFVEYDGINMGQLFYDEFHYMLVPFLKIFVELTKIMQKHKNSVFITPVWLYNIARSLIPHVNKMKNSVSRSNEFLFDSIKTHVKIGNTSITLKIPRTYYVKLRNLSEKLTSFFLKHVKNLDTKKVLLVEFDTFRYSKIFQILPKFSVNLLCYARRRPVIWNYQTFSIIRKSNCTVITYSSITGEAAKTLIQNGQEEVIAKIESMLNTAFFKKFFSVKEISFWDLIKPYFIELCKKRMLQAVEEIELAKKVFEKYRPYLVLVWSEAGFNEQIIIKLAKRFDITTILLQHGLYYDTSEAYEFNKFAGIFPLNCDKFVVWGETSKQYVIDSGISDDKMVVLGSPIHDDLFEENKKINNSRQDYVLLATSGPVSNLVNDLTVTTNERYEESIRKICQIVSKMNKRLVIKLHPSSAEVDITKIAKEVNSETEIIKSGSIFPLIKECNVLIVTDISTVIVESQILKKPVISVSIKDYGFGVPSVFKTNSCITTNIDDFEHVFEKVLNDTEFRKNTIENGTKYVNSYFANQGEASKKLFSFLEKIE